MEKRIIRPKRTLYETIILLCILTFWLGVLSIFMLCLGGGWEVIIFAVVSILTGWILNMAGTIITYRNNQIEIISEKEIIIDQKVREWKNPYSKISKGKWIHQRIKINPVDVIRIGCSFELYGKCLYYHTQGMAVSMYQEVVVETKDGKKATFDYSIFMQKHLREIIRILSCNEEIQITGYLRKILGKTFFE